MTLQRPAAARPTHASDEQVARRHALERAYPLAKQLAEVLELETIEPMATSARHVRQAIGAELAEIGVAVDPRLQAGDVVVDGLPCQDISS